ncbi:MAG: hypothetical protein FRX49_04700 [Trebouxia sp. A1-2]|nr:MAG: hypothetical protein FRX49_04700 [Trebouxia sp. A1-2]
MENLMADPMADAKAESMADPEANPQALRLPEELSLPVSKSSKALRTLFRGPSEHICVAFDKQ